MKQQVGAALKEVAAQAKLDRLWEMYAKTAGGSLGIATTVHALAVQVCNPLHAPPPPPPRVGAPRGRHKPLLTHPSQVGLQCRARYALTIKFVAPPRMLHYEIWEYC